VNPAGFAARQYSQARRPGRDRSTHPRFPAWPAGATVAVPEDQGLAKEARQLARGLPPTAARAARADALFRGSDAMGSYRSASDPTSARGSDSLLRLAVHRLHRDRICIFAPAGGRTGMSDQIEFRHCGFQLTIGRNNPKRI